MCGIIAAINTKSGKNKIKPVNDWILNQYQDQISRGQRGFGIVLIDEKNNIEVKRATEPTKFIVDLNLYPCNKILAHHRTPTSTENKIKQTHPIEIQNKLLKYNYLVVHNGIIHNATEIKKEHESLGFKYTTEMKDHLNCIKFNDSESIAIETARFIENQTTEIGAKGSMAIIALQIDKETRKTVKMFFFTDGNPLNMSKTRGKLRLSSEGEGQPIENNILYSCELKNEMELSKRKIPVKQETETSWGIIPAKVTQPTVIATNYGKTYDEHFNTHLINGYSKQFDYSEYPKKNTAPPKAYSDSEKLNDTIDIFYENEKEQILTLVEDYCAELEHDGENTDTKQVLMDIEAVLINIKNTLEEVKAAKGDISDMLHESGILAEERSLIG